MPPTPRRRRVPSHDAEADLPDGLAVAIGTSGSTGRPEAGAADGGRARAVGRGRRTRSSAAAGAWLLAMPAHHIAGLQVLLRSVAAGVDPGRARPAWRLLPRGVRRPRPTGSARASAPRGATRRSCPPSCPGSSTTPRASAALRAFDGVLVGGAATPPALVERARALGVVLEPHLRHERDGRRLRLRRDAAARQPGPRRQRPARRPRRRHRRPRLPRRAGPDPRRVHRRPRRRAVVPHRRPRPLRRRGAARHRRPRRRRHQHRRPQDQPGRRRGRDEPRTSTTSSTSSCSACPTRSGASRSAPR